MIITRPFTKALSCCVSACLVAVVVGCVSEGESLSIVGLPIDTTSPGSDSGVAAGVDGDASEEDLAGALNTGPTIAEAIELSDGGADGGAGSQNQNTEFDNAQAGSSLAEVRDNNGALVTSNPAAITEIVLVTGQSNALGLETAFDAVLDYPHPRSYAFTEDGWNIADLHQVWDLGWHPRNHPETDPTNNFGFHFARKVVERRPDRVVGFVLVTAPGEGIAHWDYESEFYLKIRNRVVDALNQLPSKASIDGVLWHQGETDWADTDLYSEKLDALISNLRSESWFDEERPFICGETVKSPVNNRLMALNNDGDQWTGCVESDGLQTLPDGFHFSAAGLRTLGARYATKYLQLTEQ